MLAGLEQNYNQRPFNAANAEFWQPCCRFSQHCFSDLLGGQSTGDEAGKQQLVRLPFPGDCSEPALYMSSSKAEQAGF